MSKRSISSPAENETVVVEVSVKQVSPVEGNAALAMALIAGVFPLMPMYAAAMMRVRSVATTT